MATPQAEKFVRDHMPMLWNTLTEAGAVNKLYAVNRTVFTADQPAQQVYYLESGQVRLFQSVSGEAERLVEIAGPRSWIGVAALSDARTFGMTARSVSTCTIWSIPIAAFLDVMSKNPELSSSVVSQLASRLVGSYTAATRLMLQDCDSRILETLLDLSTSAAAFAEDDQVAVQITHQDLAKAVGAARETVSAAISALRRQDLVRTARNRVMFDPRALRDFADSHNRKSATTLLRISSPGANQS